MHIRHRNRIERPSAQASVGSHYPDDVSAKAYIPRLFEFQVGNCAVSITLAVGLLMGSPVPPASAVTTEQLLFLEVGMDPDGRWYGP